MEYFVIAASGNKRFNSRPLGIGRDKDYEFSFGAPVTFLYHFKL